MASLSEQTLLVTGANGYVAGHIIKLALEKGYKVRGTVRSDASIPKLRDTFAQYASQLTFAIVPDITKPELYERAFESSVTGVIHTASPFVFEVKDRAKDILEPAINGAVAILDAVKLYGPCVRRVVTTSSFAAIIDVSLGHRPGHTYTEQDWNPLTYEEGMSASWGAVTYTASKALAEKGMWAWMAAQDPPPPFDLTAINPPWVFGPHVPQLDSLNGLNQSTASLRAALLDADAVPPTDFAGFVDVRDTAAAHIAALETPEAGGQRFLLGGHFDYQSAADAVRAELPELMGRVPQGQVGKGWEEEVYEIDGSKAERMLRIEYTPLAVTMRDTFLELLEAERTGGGKPEGC
ncbi:NAD-dependent epimerase dehydratase [Pleurostoma richardsiae]|uniref:NAD-dependent epimerase dehydratase n=1 Tax=Pleurostoma richardsiae TaxID=41990 RepID=A0AA38VS15_9PEZI|nr:NAD-dependent epimerase dehydratase [Pleurostoma richardsiae]